MLKDSETLTFPIFLQPKFKCLRLTTGGDCERRLNARAPATLCMIKGAFFLFPAMSEAYDEKGEIITYAIITCTVR